MRVIDFTHTIHEGMPVYPGTEPPSLRIANTYAQDGFRETKLMLYSHVGTHMDAPAHLFEGLSTLDAYPAAAFVGKGIVIDASDAGRNGCIGMGYISRHRPAVEQADFLLFHTGWEKYWGKPVYFEAYPCITEEVARYCIESGKRGIGLDTISVDPVSEPTLPLHRLLLGQNTLVIIENLTNLHHIVGELFTFCALPLKFESADGAPVRAIGILA